MNSDDGRGDVPARPSHEGHSTAKLGVDVRGSRSAAPPSPRRALSVSSSRGIATSPTPCAFATGGQPTATCRRTWSCRTRTA